MKMLHYSKHLCSMWRPRSVGTQYGELAQFFKSKCVCAVTYIHYDLQMPIMSPGNLKEKCQTFLLEFSCEKWSNSLVKASDWYGLVSSELIPCWTISFVMQNTKPYFFFLKNMFHWKEWFCLLNEKHFDQLSYGHKCAEILARLNSWPLI